MVFGRLGEKSAGSATKSRILGGNYTNLMSKGVRLPPSIPKKSADQDLKNLPTGAEDILSGARRMRGGASRVPARVPAAERGDLLDLLRPEPQSSRRSLPVGTGPCSLCSSFFLVPVHVVPPSYVPWSPYIRPNHLRPLRLLSISSRLGLHAVHGVWWS